MFKKWLANLITYIILDRLLNIIDDRTYDDRQELEGLRADFDEYQSTVDNMQIDVEDKPSYHDMESHVEHTVNDGIADIIERVETLENA
mgnify:FL=1|tara:strand:+ start:193 stop:459 length:267 start_codon:yes stop_codon:yes gene_type:complete